jgi:hypothetical protein
MFLRSRSTFSASSLVRSALNRASLVARLQQFFSYFVGSFGDCLYDRTHQPGNPALVAFSRVTVGKGRHRDALEQLLWVYFTLGYLIGALHRAPDDYVSV